MKDLKFMIIEDEALIKIDIQKSLEYLGYKVCAIAKDYDEAMEQYKQYKPDVIFVDVNLGKRSKTGIEFVEELQKENQPIVIYLTSYSNDEIIEQIMETNPAGYIVKPFKLEQIKVSVALAVKQKSKLDILEAFNLTNISEEKLHIVLQAMNDNILALGEDNIENNYDKIKDELAHNILLESLHGLADYPERMQDCDEFKSFVLRVEVVKDMLLNL